jgi:isoleucyl-tRNA synthetase
MAPFTPFLSEEMYQNLVCSAFPDAPDSVHLADFPVGDKSKIDERLSVDIRLAMKVSSLGRAARSQAGIKVRQPLARLLVQVRPQAERRALKRLESQVLEEVNVKSLDFLEDIPATIPAMEAMVSLDTTITPELQAEGMAREIVHRLQTMRRSAGFDIADHIATYFQGDDYLKQVMVTFGEYIKQETLSRDLVEGIPEGEEDVFTGDYKLGGYDVLLGVKRIVLT